ncbi:MAG TPA: PEP-CTERM sorting domain-containing protein [Terriglobales bacterium]|nr:PEP-CTERM sorting domain-containing protein [Terriglobales bacterium]
MGHFVKVLMLVLLLGLATTLLAETVTVGNPNVSYSVNDGTNFYVSNTSIFRVLPGGTVASAPVAGNFWQITNTPTYSDAGVVLYFSNPLLLGDLRSISVTSDNPSAINVNLWLDTGNNGTLFSFSGTQFTGLNGDSYAGASGSFIDQDTLFYMFGGNGAGTQYTLGQLQAGADSGIDANTRVALWVGITNADVANISKIDVTSVPEPATMSLLGAGFVAFAFGLRKRISR